MKDEKAWKWLNENELSYSIWEKKYRYNNETLDEWLDRVSAGNKEIRDLIYNKKFAFGGRILANRGIENSNVSLSNCYVITPPEDTLEDITRVCKDLAITYSRGGGCGVDISKLRPAGAKVNNAAKESTGPVSFMQIYSNITGTIAQEGRRGALMISLDINHPDIETFIDCKTDLNAVTYANISVRVNELFMEAVEQDKAYLLRWPCDTRISDEEFDYRDYPYDKLQKLENSNVYVKKVRAKELFNKLCKNNWDYAEPGILFWDNVETYNLLGNNPEFKYAGVNPCEPFLCMA